MKRTTKRTTKKPTRQLTPGTRVTRSNGQRGRIQMVFTYRIDGPVKDYLVETPRGLGLWRASEIRIGW